jgi:hypothetical protein
LQVAQADDTSAVAVTVGIMAPAMLSSEFFSLLYSASNVQLTRGDLAVIAFIFVHV